MEVLACRDKCYAWEQEGPSSRQSKEGEVRWESRGMQESQARILAELLVPEYQER